MEEKADPSYCDAIERGVEDRDIREILEKAEGFRVRIVEEEMPKEREGRKRWWW